MIGLTLGLGLSTPVRSSGGGGPTGTFPFAPGTIGFETDWIFTGDWSWDAGTSSIRVNGSAGSATLTGAAKTAFDAAIANSTTFNCSTILAGAAAIGTVTGTIKGGASQFSFDTEFDGEAAGPGDSGTGSGFVFAVSFGTPDCRMTTLTLTPQ